MNETPHHRKNELTQAFLDIIEAEPVDESGETEILNYLAEAIEKKRDKLIDHKDLEEILTAVINKLKQIPNFSPSKRCLDLVKKAQEELAKTQTETQAKTQITKHLFLLVQKLTTRPKK